MRVHPPILRETFLGIFIGPRDRHRFYGFLFSQKEVERFEQ